MAEHFAAWYGPAGASVQVMEMDVRAGGRRHFSMQFQTPDGERQMWFVGEFREVDPPAQLGYTESMSDPDGNVGPPEAVGLPSGHPESTKVTVQFEDLEGRTRMVMSHAGVPADSPSAMGWNMALDKLEAYLAA